MYTFVVLSTDSRTPSSLPLSDPESATRPISFDDSLYASVVYHLNTPHHDPPADIPLHNGDQLVNGGAVHTSIRRRHDGGRRSTAHHGASLSPAVADATRRETPLGGLRDSLYRANILLQQSYVFLDFQCFREDGVIIACEFAIRPFVYTCWQNVGQPEQRTYQTTNTQFGLVGATKPFAALSNEDKHTNNYRRQEIHGIWYTTFDNGRNTHLAPTRMNQIIAETIASVLGASAAPTIIVMKGREKLSYFRQMYPQYRNMVRVMPEPYPAILQPCSKYHHHDVARRTPSCAFANVHFMEAVLDRAGYFVA